jgi:tRNA pseudouridine55 synthase
LDGILPIDKPQGMTSHDAVFRMRKALGEKRIGHSGTLDPMATGVLVLYIGRATRLIEYAGRPGDPAAKAYRCTMKLGLETDTQDVWGETIRAWDGPLPDGESVRAALASFRGESLQTPPMYSAVKVGGRKLYELARRGEVPEDGAVKARRIFINNIIVNHYDRNAGEAVFDIECGKGVYVRTVCADAGRLLGCGAAMSGLVRTRSDGFALADCAADTVVEGGALPSLLPVDAALGWMARAELDDAEARRFCNGLPAAAEQDAEPEGTGGKVRVYGPDGFLGVGRVESGAIRPEKVVRG